MKVRKGLSLDSDVLNKGLKKAAQNYMTFSGYITYLINKDTPEMVTETKKPNKQIDKAIASIISGINEEED